MKGMLRLIQVQIMERLSVGQSLNGIEDLVKKESDTWNSVFCIRIYFIEEPTISLWQRTHACHWPATNHHELQETNGISVYLGF